MHVISGNFGNATIALMQWVHDHQLDNVVVVGIDTGWAAVGWEQRVKDAQALAERYGFCFELLQSPLRFTDIVTERNDFPTPKYQWCAGLLKGLPLNAWLDEHDPQCEASVLLGKRRSGSRVNAELPEKISESEFFGDRTVWHPLYQCDDDKFTQLIAATGLSMLTHRSLECDPCVNNCLADFQRLAPQDVAKTQQLEQQIGKPMFAPEAWDDSEGIEAVVKATKSLPAEPNNNTEDDSGNCGSPFGCGL
ncbi:MAG: hypothetical protein CMF50_10395 [Legionellales bacterium]|nr:hypothetical protein [Legionellales bacterium]|tara:strand:+ start:3939 stop:4688 length:750 start_codon:yes stop_codon:yes gene_type:complete